MANLDEIFKHTVFINEQHKAYATLLYLGTIADKHLVKSLEPFNLPINQYRILRGLKRIYPQGIGVYKLKDFLQDKDADISRLVDRMVKRGLVIRNEDKLNKSRIQVTITTTGLNLITELESHLPEFVKPMMCLSQEEAKNLSHVFERLVDCFSAESNKLNTASSR